MNGGCAPFFGKGSIGPPMSFYSLLGGNGGIGFSVRLVIGFTAPFWGPGGSQCRVEREGDA